LGAATKRPCTATVTCPEREEFRRKLGQEISETKSLAIDELQLLQSVQTSLQAELAGMQPAGENDDRISQAMQRLVDNTTSMLENLKGLEKEITSGVVLLANPDSPNDAASASVKQN